MKILIADDDPVSLLNLQGALEDWGYEVIAVNDGAAAWAELDKADAPTIAIIDWMMPGMEGVEICRRVRQRVQDRYVYLIMLTSKRETAFVVQAMNAGADDFISKPFDIEELQVRVRAGRRIVELEEELRIRASHDALTDTWNRGAIMQLLEQELARARREKAPTSVMMLDLDRFKSINDNYGHRAGDEVLREMVERVKRALRPYDACGRYGGEEFLVVLPKCDLESAARVAERARSAMADADVSTEGASLKVTFSVGVACTTEHGDALAPLIEAADKALYGAKRAGRNCVIKAEK